METVFDHEKLKVYQRTIEFVAWSSELNGTGKSIGPIGDQLARASSSIALNIAEGNGKSSARDRCRFFEIARGSALECSACLDVLAARNRISPDQIGQGKRLLREIVAMLVGLMKSLADRVAEEETGYGGEPKGEQAVEQEQE